MTRIVGVSVLFSALAATAACGVGDDDGMGGGSGTPIPTIDEGEVCGAEFTVSGTFTPGTTPRPTDPETGMTLSGCWPVGTWNFTAAMRSNQCTTAPMVLSSYSFRVDRVTPPEGGNDTVQQLVNLTSLNGLQYHLSVSSNGQGCEGHFEFGSADGTQYWNMKPTLSKDPAATAIGGEGYYTLYKSNAWPWR